MKHIESNIQRSCVKYFDIMHPTIKMNLFKIDNDGKRSVIAGSIAKQMGLRSGAADMFLAVPNKKYNGFFIEFKAPKGKPTENQIAFCNAVVNHGYKYSLIMSLDDFINEIEYYLKQR